jgi:integrase
MLSDAIQEFLVYRKGAGFADNTILINKRALSKLLALVGNIQVRHLEARHGEQYQAFLMAKGYMPNTVNAYLTAMSALVKWLRSRRYLGAGSDPMANVRAVKGLPEPRQRLERHEFPYFLEEADTPYGRVVLALGLFLFLRASEISALKVGDVNLDTGEVVVRVQKTKELDVMPISLELERELRRYLTWYQYDTLAPLKPDMYLVPQMRRLPMANDGSGPGGGYLIPREHGNAVPYEKNRRPHRYVKKALAAFGIPLRGDDGKSLREGCHTLRRSGARALFDELVESGSYDGVLRLVSAMLHHKSVQTTERYLGLNVDVKKRNDLLRGAQMFTYADDVIEAAENIARLA